MSQNEEKEEGEEGSKSNSLTKLVKMAEVVNKQAFNLDGSVDLSNIREIWQQNVILLSCYFS